MGNSNSESLPYLRTQLIMIVTLATASSTLIYIKKVQKYILSIKTIGTRQESSIN